jgi:hypothetical protein
VQVTFSESSVPTGRSCRKPRFSIGSMTTNL